MPSKINLTCLQNFIFPTTPPVMAHESPISTKILLIIRIFAALHLTGVYFYDFTILNALLDKFLMLTNVAYFVTWLYFLVVVQSRFFPIFKGLDQYAQILFQTSFCTSWIITVGYWAYLRPSLPTGFTLDFFWSLNAHGISLFLLILDFVFNSYRFVYSQYIFFILVCGGYLLLINLPYSIQVKPIYGKAMNWKQFYTYVFILAGFVGSLIAHFISRQIYLHLKLPNLKNEIEQLQNQRKKTNSNSNSNSPQHQQAFTTKIQAQNTNVQGNSNFNLQLNIQKNQKQVSPSVVTPRNNKHLEINLEGGEQELVYSQVGVRMCQNINVINVKPKQYITPVKMTMKSAKKQTSPKKSTYKNINKQNQNNNIQQLASRD